MHTTKTILLLALAALKTADADADDQHPFEYGGLFTTPQNTYVWSAQKVNGTYADDTMKIVVLPVSANTHEQIEAVEESAEAHLEAACTIATDGMTLAPQVCYLLTFDTAQHTTTFFVDTSTTDFAAIFTQHSPTEFESEMHYFKSVAGEDAEAEHTLPEAPPPPPAAAKPWGVAIGAAIVVNIVTLCGVVFTVPLFARVRESFPVPLTVGINAFAAGALLSAAFYLMFDEATALIAPAGSTEAEQSAWWGSAILLGFFAAYLAEVFVTGCQELATSRTASEEGEAGASEDATASVDAKAKTTTVAATAVEADEAALGATAEPVDGSRQRRVLVGVLLGDFMHNLVDGIFIGFAFMTCGSATGWTITGVTVAHEVGQEISDQLILTDPAQGNLKPWKALLANFVCGISVILGVIIALAQGAQDNFSSGMLLAFGGGIYVNIGATECMSRCAAVARTLLLRIEGVMLFIIGAVVVGVTLVSHEHCSAASGDGGGHVH